ncbi:MULTISPECIES: S26 family signal peptidase [Cysteiniphilum]|uniref:Putative conjugal transfer protein TraF n=1 Tax=Cysteiniphilum litorale TaxID=2056700 RepID=A0A8J2Z3J1_9GAMM|nr:MULTISPECIES: S26 family signal peptidase [Cysteiniphilum]GGF93706.1 putative conjugal transfer protein TraF [Cysteiniphilum litorale]
MIKMSNTVKPSKYNHKKMICFCLVIALPMLVLWLVVYPYLKSCGYIINVTPSMPYGLYKEVSFKANQSEHINIGSIVLSCLPDQAAKVAVNNGYLVHSSRCENGFEPVLKEVIAVSGDKVFLHQGSIKVVTDKGKIAFYQAPVLRISPSGLKVPSLIKENHFSLTNQVWLYGSYDYQLSWDSRYFGTVNMQEVIGLMEPILTF